ncbi:hypothetical protein [Paraclostridium bifermentans]|uniref:hypothetical protein n=1 Tax=Paraclostridium bifermentans TaxID=1490 RepID=UPI00374E649B
MNKIDKCFACGYEVPEKADYYEEFQEVPCARVNQEDVDVLNEVSTMYACPCCGTVRATFHTGYKDKDEIYDRANQPSKRTFKLDLDGLTSK